jgi:hypothetical protein
MWKMIPSTRATSTSAATVTPMSWLRDGYRHHLFGTWKREWQLNNGDPGCGDGSPKVGVERVQPHVPPGDFNGDGYSDVLMRNPGSGGYCACSPAVGDGYEYWSDPPDPACGDGTPIGTDANFFDMITGPGDMNGDGFNDILGRKSSDLSLEGDGHGSGHRTWNQTCTAGLVGTGWGMYNPRNPQ